MDFSYKEGLSGGLEGFFLLPPSQEQFVQWKAKFGAHIVKQDDTYWEEVRKGFFQPFHLLAKLQRDHVRKPRYMTWGYRAALVDDDLVHANGSIMVHEMSDLESFSLSSLSSKRRNHVNRSLKRVEFREISDLEFLKQAGYKVQQSCLRRTRHMASPSKREFHSFCERNINPGDNSRAIVAGFVDGELAGFSSIYCIERYAYLDTTFIASEYLETSIGTGLLYQIIELCKRSSEIKVLINGLHARENKDLNHFKKNFGFRVVSVPARVEINPIASYMLRKRYPHKHYRLTGNDSGCTTNPDFNL